MKWTLASTVLLVVLAASARAESFRSSDCPCAFDIPSGWSVKEEADLDVEHVYTSATLDKIEICSLGLRPQKWPVVDPDDDREYGAFAVQILVVREAFEHAAGRLLFWQVRRVRREFGSEAILPGKRGSDWVVLDYGDHPSETTSIRGAGWHGIKGSPAVGTGRDRRFVHRAVLTNGDLSVFVLADNPYVQVEFDNILRSFAFVPRRAN